MESKKTVAAMLILDTQEFKATKNHKEKWTLYSYKRNKECTSAKNMGYNSFYKY